MTLLGRGDAGGGSAGGEEVAASYPFVLYTGDIARFGVNYKFF
jgi:hypothetical protein